MTLMMFIIAIFTATTFTLFAWVIVVLIMKAIEYDLKKEE